MALSRRLRFEILRRDGHTCRYCGAKAPEAQLTIDHVIPTTLGGGDDSNNLVAACAPCNGGKSSIPADAQLVEDVDAAAFLWARAMEKAAERRRAEINALDQLVEAFDRHWRYYADDPQIGPIDRDHNWPESLERFIKNGLDIEDLHRLLDVAIRASKIPNSKVWRYFCGCCWNEITDRQELARILIEEGEV